jgi:flagellar biosynthesis protein FliR
MTAAASAEALLGPALLVFFRVAGFVMLLPGFSSLRVPARIRLMLALALALAIAPLSGVEGGAATPMALIVETINGVVLGLLVRVLFLAFHFSATTIASFIGLAGMPGAPLDSEDAMAPVSALISLTATALVFASGMHHQLIRGLVSSYDVLPAGRWIAPEAALRTLTDTLGEAFLLAMQLAMPFLIYAVVVNVAIGIANKLSPQIPVYFISMPLVIAGGLIVLHGLGPDMLALFAQAVSARLSTGWW